MSFSHRGLHEPEFPGAVLFIECATFEKTDRQGCAIAKGEDSAAEIVRGGISFVSVHVQTVNGKCSCKFWHLAHRVDCNLIVVDPSVFKKDKIASSKLICLLDIFIGKGSIIVQYDLFELILYGLAIVVHPAGEAHKESGNNDP